MQIYGVTDSDKIPGKLPSNFYVDILGVEKAIKQTLETATEILTRTWLLTWLFS